MSLRPPSRTSEVRYSQKLIFMNLIEKESKQKNNTRLKHVIQVEAAEGCHRADVVFSFRGLHVSLDGVLSLDTMID